MYEHKLSAPPQIRVEVVHDHGRTEEGFVQVRTLELQNRFSDGSVSAPYRYALVERKLLDAVVIVLWRRRGATPYVLLRSQLRPPLAFREGYDVPLLAAGTGAVQWEVPAGLCELGEAGVSGLLHRAAVETLEEAGLTLDASRFALLGPASSLSPGLIAEKLHFVWAEVTDADEAVAPSGDGHPVEGGSVCAWIQLSEALRAIDEELIHDMKTEVGLYRLQARLGSA